MAVKEFLHYFIFNFTTSVKKITGSLELIKIAFPNSRINRRKIRGKILSELSFILYDNVNFHEYRRI